MLVIPKIIIENTAVLNWLWVGVFFIRTLLNATIYRSLGYDETKGTRAFVPNYAEFVLSAFSFWWSKKEQENNIKEAKAMVISNYLNLGFIGYSTLLFVIYLVVPEG